MRVSRRETIKHLSEMKKIIQHYGKIYRILPRKYINALVYYKGHGSRFINEFLYSGKINPKYLSLEYFKNTQKTFFRATEEKVPKYYKLPSENIVEFVRYNIKKRLEFINKIDEIFELSTELGVYKLSGKEKLFRLYQV